MNKKIRRAFVGVGMLLFFFATPVSAVTNDQVNYWAFDDATGQSIGDTGGQNGVMIGTSTGFGWAGGKSGTALGMDGTPGTGIAIPNGILSGSQGSLSVWLKMSDLSDRNVIFSGKSTSDNNVFVALSVDFEGRPQLVFRTDPSGQNRKIQGGAILNKNEWYHLVLVATGQSYKMFINGEEKIITGENIGRWFPDFTNQTFMYRIGTSEANPLIGSWSGMLDEFRIYARALSPEDVLELYNAGNIGTPTVPLALRPKTPSVVEGTTTPTPVADNTPAVPVTEVIITSPTATFLRDLSLGARGEDVKNLQLLLVAEGYLAPGLTSGYFGMLTKDALAKLQAKRGLPATGFFGAMTRANLGAGSGGTPVTTPPPAVVANPNAQIAELLKLIAELQVQLAKLKAGTPQ